MNFREFNLKKEILSQIESAGFNKPTPVQEKAIPSALEGKDLLALAKTGTGKTAAFVLPIIQKIAESDYRGSIYALIIAPTRELAEQINKTINHFGKDLDIKSMAVYGGTSIKKQVDMLKEGVDIVVGCPGRILDHIEHGTMDISDIETLVLDEADHMLDMGFLKDIEKIIESAPEYRQTLFFSATMPEEIRKLASKVLRKNHETIEIQYKESVKLIEHELYHIENDKKKAKLVELLKNPEMQSVIVFTSGKHKANHLCRILLNKGFKANNFQGDLTQKQREESLNGFRNGEYRILVATDIAARGLDIPQVTHVVNYDMPKSPEAFIHRSGRTGRADKGGTVISFATSEDQKIVEELKSINKLDFKIID